LGGIRTHNLSRRAAEDLRLRPHGYWDRQRPLFTTTIAATATTTTTTTTTTNNNNNNSNRGNMRMNVTVRRFRVTTVALQK